MANQMPEKPTGLNTHRYRTDWRTNWGQGQAHGLTTITRNGWTHWRLRSRQEAGAIGSWHSCWIHFQSATAKLA